MKKFLTLTFVALLSFVAFTACKSSKNANCDAYGEVNQIHQNDTAAK
jgi:hypothetical protein